MSKTTHINDAHPTATPVWVPAAKIAEVLHCHPRTVARLAERGVIPPPVTLGGLRRWDLHRVLAALQTA